MPFNEHAYKGPDQWKEVVKKDLAGRFNKEHEPLWRISFLKGENEGQIIITFHHAIADGICAMQMMNHFYQICSQLLNNKEPKKVEYNTSLPKLETLYHLSLQEPVEDAPPPERVDKGYHTTFVKDTLDEVISSEVIKWSKAHEVKVHATLFAAYLQAIRRVINPNFKEFTAATAVNFRPFFNPPFSKEVLMLMRTIVAEKFPVSGNEDLSGLAKAINQSVHSQMDAGQHVLNLKELVNRLKRNPSPNELWCRAKLPANTVAVTNLGSLDFSGKYGSKLSLEELFFVANVEPFIDEPTNFVLGTFTFQGKTSLTLWFLEELVQDSLGQAILSEMKKILSQTRSIHKPKAGFMEWGSSLLNHLCCKC